MTTLTSNNLIGETFGEWLVLNVDSSLRKYKARYWICQCSCGLTKPVIGRDLIKGISTRCRKCQGKKQRIDRVINLIGHKYGKWLVLNVDNESKRKGTYWICKCECGLTKSVRAKDLRHGGSNSCVECGHRNLIKNVENCLPEWIWHTLRHSAKRRNLTLDVSKEYCYKLFTEQRAKCALSGLDLYISKNWSEHKKTKTTASIDRIDSSKGYIIDNIQWVHKHVNGMKFNMQEDYFIKLCKLIANNQPHV